jgi:CheY-like chemotaxis protein
MSDQATILLAEDREDDVLLIRKVFERAGLDNPLQVVHDGEQAIEYLAGAGKFSNRAEYALPWLILLDLKMPKVDGFEVLRWVRQQPGLSSTILVVLTSSEQLRDVNLAYQLGANSFLVKPVDFTNAFEMSKLIKQYWFQHDRFPEIERERRLNADKPST